jgi:DMSO/TMAO reductase YedYZ molybdopterin-dependent catalytic subunit
MSSVSRRRFLVGGVAAVAGVSGLAVADRLARRYELIPPDSAGVWGPGETLTYAAQRILGAHAPAHQFPRSMISKKPFANEVAPLGDVFQRSQAADFKDWKLTVDGMVAHPTAFSLADLKSMPMQSQITEVACEEGWSYIAEWIGTPLHGVLNEVGILPQTRYIVYRSFQSFLWESIDMADALHPQTFLTMGMNDGDLPVGFGGPLRLRLPRQLGYKSLKYVTHITALDSVKHYGNGRGSVDPDYGYAWYAGI